MDSTKEPFNRVAPFEDDLEDECPDCDGKGHNPLDGSDCELCDGTGAW